MKEPVKKFTVKKLFLGHVSIRDYIVKECQDKQKDLLIKYEDQEMLVPCQELQYCSSRFYTETIKSKTGGKDYKLIDFKFKPNKGE